MELTLKSITLLVAVLLTGLSAGLFYAWEVSVIPGTKKITDHTYIDTMQAINRAIINPGFMVIFLGSLVLQIISTYQQRGTFAFWFLLTATLSYFLGTVLVTGMGNVPLNNALDALNQNDLNQEQLTSYRNNYELKWNRLHSLRTVFSVLSFILMVLGLFNLNK